MEKVPIKILSRQIVLFSNKLIFTQDEKTKPRSSNVIYLGDIVSFKSDSQQLVLLVHIQLIRKFRHKQRFFK